MDTKIPDPLKNSNAELIPLDGQEGRVDLQALMQVLAKREVNELQVEAGATLAGSLLDSQLVDEVVIYQAPVLLGSGTREPFAFGPLHDMQQRISMQWIETIHTGPDLRMRLKPEYEKV